MHNVIFPRVFFVDTLYYYFKKFGEILHSVIMYHKESNKSRGFGFVVFADDETAEQVCRGRHCLDGKLVEVKRAVPKTRFRNSLNDNEPVRAIKAPLE